MHDARHDPSQPSDARPMSPPNASIEGITLRSEPATLGIFYHIAPPEELHPLTDIESLRLDNDSLREQIAVLSRQQAAILATLARHADVLQNIVLGGDA